jgi:prepilin-type N-terminal cleavage/methylation domain-containing protein
MLPFSHSAARRRQGFTLLEVVLAVMVLSLTAIGMFRFVRANLQAIQYSVEDAEDQLSVERMVALIQEELYNLPIRNAPSSLIGEDLTTNQKDFDSMEWSSRAGPGLLTTAAIGDYKTRLMMRPVEGAKTAIYEIGLRRRPVALDAAGGVVAAGSDRDATWVPLLPRTIGLRIRYWDPRLGQLYPNWREPASRPMFVVLSILREGETAPYEAVLTVPAALTQQ